MSKVFKLSLGIATCQHESGQALKSATCCLQSAHLAAFLLWLRMLGATWKCFHCRMLVHQGVDEQAVFTVPSSCHPVSVLIHRPPSRSHKDSDKGLSQPDMPKYVIGLLLYMLARHLPGATKGIRCETHLQTDTHIIVLLNP